MKIKLTYSYNHEPSAAQTSSGLRWSTRGTGFVISSGLCWRSHGAPSCRVMGLRERLICLTPALRQTSTCHVNHLAEDSQSGKLPRARGIKTRPEDRERSEDAQLDTFQSDLFVSSSFTSSVLSRGCVIFSTRSARRRKSEAMSGRHLLLAAGKPARTETSSAGQNKDSLIWDIRLWQNVWNHNFDLGCFSAVTFKVKREE